jgi:predicted dehydrogenase
MKADSMPRREVLKATACMVAAGFGAGTGRAEGQAPKPALRLPRTVRVGIIGLEGHISEILSVTSASPQVRLMAIAESDPELLPRASDDPLLKEAALYSDYREMLDKQQLDVVAVCGENGTRATTVQACADRRLAIVAEKPLALTLSDLQRTREKIVANGVPFTMLLSMRFEPQYQKMHEIVRSGYIGEVVAMTAQKSYQLGDRPAWMKRRQTFGGIIPYIAIHMADLMLWVSGRDFAEAAAFQSNVGYPGIGDMENNAAVIFRMDNRGTATVRLDYLRPATAPTHGDDRLRIAGTNGVVEYQGATGLTLVTREKAPEQIHDLPPAGSLFGNFLEAVYNGSKPVLTPDEIFRVNEVVLKARDAAENRTIVSVY